MGGTIFFGGWHSYNTRPTRELVRTWPATWRRNICQVGRVEKMERTSRCYELKVNNRCVVQRMFFGEKMWCYDDFLRMIELFLPSRELTYPPKMAYLKMIFLFPRWDMLVLWRVSIVLMLILFICVELFSRNDFWLPRRCAETTCSLHVGSAGFLATQKKERSSGGGEILRVQAWYNQVVFSSKIRILTGLIW